MLCYAIVVWLLLSLMPVFLRRSLIALVLCSPLPTYAESYVTDSVTVSVFPTADLSGEPVARLKSGAPVEVLEQRDELRRIKSENGQVGWMRATFIMSSIPAVQKLAEIKKDIAQLEAELEAAQGKNVDLAAKEEKANKTVAWMRAEMNKARNETKALEVQLQEARSKDSDAGAIVAKVEEEVGQLKREKEDLEKRLGATLMINQLSEPVVEETAESATSSYIWPLATLMVGGLLGGAISYAWMDRRLRQRFGGIRLH